MTTPLTIATACDNAYVRPTAVFLRSLVASNPETDIRLFVFVQDNFKYRTTLQKYFGLPFGRLEFITVDQNNMGMLPEFTYKHSSISSYFRLLIGTLLPLSTN